MENSAANTPLCMRNQVCSGPKAEFSRVKAEDPELDAFEFAIKDDAIDAKFPFKIDKEGYLSVVNPRIDREDRKEYEFDVLARNVKMPNPLTSAARVRVLINDEDDMAPKPINGSMTIYFCTGKTKSEPVHFEDPDLPKLRRIYAQFADNVDSMLDIVKKFTISTTGIT